MNTKVIVAGVVLVGGLILGAINFFESNVEYMDFSAAERLGKKAQVKGEWVRDRESSFDIEKAQFTFYMKDDAGKIVRVVLEGAKPNNFEIATSVVVKGKFMGDHFHATEVLTKCPSKYEGDAEAVKQSL
ncbi:MAG TPA: cytochrome c maturation protein CcmE [Bacteroidota bacterium]|nr:cytochrome c maturation protein CcmE [Bacteroidota bacterium]